MTYHSKPSRPYSRARARRRVDSADVAYALSQMAAREGSPVQMAVRRLPDDQRPRVPGAPGVPPGAVRWYEPKERPASDVEAHQPAATNRFRAGDVLTPGEYTRDGLHGEIIIIASYGEFVDYGFFPYGEMAPTETARRIWIGNLTHVSPIRK